MKTTINLKLILCNNKPNTARTWPALILASLTHFAGIVMNWSRTTYETNNAQYCTVPLELFN